MPAVRTARSSDRVSLYGFGDFAGLQAARADVLADGVPPTSMRTFCRFGLKRRRVATIEWLRLLPNAGPFLHDVADLWHGGGG